METDKGNEEERETKFISLENFYSVYTLKSKLKPVGYGKVIVKRSVLDKFRLQFTLIIVQWVFRRKRLKRITL